MEELKKTVALYEKMLNDLSEIGHHSMYTDDLRRSKYALEDAIRKLEERDYNIDSYKRVMLNNVSDRFDAETRERLKNNWMSNSEVAELYAKEFGEM